MIGKNHDHVSKVAQIIFLFQIILLVLTGQHALAEEEENTEQVKQQSPGLQVKIIVQGLSNEEKKNALAYLEIKEEKENPLLNELWLKQLHSKAKKDIQKSLQPFGYYQVVVESHLEQNSEGVWNARYEVKAGERVKYTKIDLQITGSGKDDPEIIAAQKNFPIKKNDFLDHELYESAKTELLALIGNQGYADAIIEKKQLLLDPEKNTVGLILHISTGEQYYLGQFRFHQDSLKPELLNRYIQDIRQGDLYSQKRLLSLQQSFVRSGYFSVVDVKPEFSETENQQVPIDITLLPVKQHKLSFGIGYDTEVELNASARWQNRLVNTSGHHTDVRLNLSSKLNTLKGTYWMPAPAHGWLPGTDPRTDKIGFTAKLENEDVADIYRETMDLDVSYVYKWKDWDTKLFLEYKFERYEIGSESYDNTNLLSIGSRLDGLFFEPGVYPRKGWSAFADLRGSPGLISSTEYIRLHMKSKIIFPVLADGRLLLRGELGLAGAGDKDKYPSSLRFYAGGDQSVRGYNWKSLGPNNSNGDVIGGKNVLTASIEYNHKVAKQWVIAGFFDAGNAFNDELDKLYYGAGIGGRWISPVGLVRLDVGWPINDDKYVYNRESPVLYFGFEVSL